MSLYQSGPHTPRPKPPAQARRGNAADKLLAELALPPPYTSAQNTPERGVEPEDDSFSFPVSSPVTATAQLLGLPVTSRRQVAMSMTHGVSHQSREELKKLLAQTELLIQDRERDLTVAATVGKALLDTNLMLKTKHDALLARLPSTPTDTVRTPHSRTASRTNELWATDDEQVVGSNLAAASPSTPIDGHSRRISATPQALAFLQEQNEQLLSQLTQIESEASEASNVGKVKLRQLEKEISGLRAELDASRERAGELEQTMERQRNEEQRLKLRREEREERAQASRNQRLRAATTDTNAPVQDFAPSSRPPRRPNVFGMNTPERESSDHETERDVFGPVNDNGGSDLVEAALKANDGKRGSDDELETDFGPAPNSQEYDIITQLLSKIAELESANRDIVNQAARTNERLDRAEKDANSIRKMYEGLEKEIEPISEEDEPGTVRIRGRRASSARRGEGPSPTESTHSRKRTNSGTSLRPKLSASSLRSSPRGARGAGNKAISFNNRMKARRPLTQGLFAPPSSLTPRASRDRLGKLARDHRLVDFPEEQGGHSRTPSTSSAIINPTSGISSIASSISRMAGNSGTALRTLGSELGEEFGADWGQGGTNHFITDDEGDLAEAEDEHEQGSSLTPVSPKTMGPNPGMAALQSALEGQGRLLEQDEHIVPLGGLRGAPGEAFFLLAKAVASRPNRWIDSDDPQEIPARQRTISSVAHRQSALAHHQYQVMSARKLAKSAAREDPWEANKYPDTESDVGGDGDTDVERPSSKSDRRKTRRDLALDRMALTIRTRHHDTSSIPTPPDTESLHSVTEEDGSTAVMTPTPTRTGHLRKTSRSPDEASFEVIENSEVESAEYDPLAADKGYGPGALAQKIKRTWSSTLFEVWILLQAVVIIAAFVWTLSKKGPRAVVGAAEKKRY